MNVAYARCWVEEKVWEGTGGSFEEMGGGSQRKATREAIMGRARRAVKER